MLVLPAVVLVPGAHTARFVALLVLLVVSSPLLNIFMMLATCDQVVSLILPNWLLVLSVA